MTDDDLPEPFPLAVTCATDGCENFGITIEVMTFEHAIVTCGPCGTVLVADAEDVGDN